MLSTRRQGKLRLTKLTYISTYMQVYKHENKTEKLRNFPVNIRNNI